VNGSANESGPLGARYGAFGGLAKRVVARLIRFYTFRQEAVNRDLDARLQMLEGVPEARGDGQIQLRAAHAALAARVTHLQRELAQLRERLDRIEHPPE
jgi:hypothetical protein